MFNKPKPTQLELFSAAPEARAGRKNYSSLFFEHFAAYERNIILAIAFIIIFITAYALGIEKGKKIVFSENENKIVAPLNTTKAVSTAVQVKINNNKTPIAAPARIEKKAATSEETYTVQVASFRSKALAEKEKLSLEKKGFAPYVFSKNDFTIVCVGPFESRDKAQLGLKQLRHIYSDCLIKKL